MNWWGLCAAVAVAALSTTACSQSGQSRNLSTQGTCRQFLSLERYESSVLVPASSRTGSIRDFEQRLLRLEQRTRDSRLRGYLAAARQGIETFLARPGHEAR